MSRSPRSTKAPSTYCASALLLTALAALCAVEARGGQDRAESAGIEFFEAKIRPLLAGRCFPCHSARNSKPPGGLYLDSRPALLRGGQGGPAVVLGDPAQSLLIQAIRYTDEKLQMPPMGRLSDEQVADFEAWVRMGAPYPSEKTSSETAGLSGDSLSRARQHWAFRPLQPCPLPVVRLKRWPKSPIDFFVLAKLEEKGLKPSPPADRRTWIRRATFDLTGLPPAPKEVDLFQKDSSPDAYARVVDRLLASPRYGERWGRYWLDLARYADTKGYVFTSEHRFAHSYTYRDWVIRAFNEDLPYDQFLIQQIAADLLPMGSDKRPLAAMGFLTLGRRFLNNVHDIIDDRIDVVTRTTMGITVACARCHDHKYDPIPTQDYYSLYGVFASSQEPKKPPRIGDAPNPEDYASYERERARLDEDVQRYLEDKHKELTANLRSPPRVIEYLQAALEAPQSSQETLELTAEKRSLNLFLLQRWKKYLDQDGAAAYAEVLPHLTASGGPSKDDYVLLEKLLEKPEAPPNVPLEEVERLFNRAERDHLTRLRKKIDQLDATHPGNPPCAMALEDSPSPENPRVFIRGNPRNPGDAVPRRFLALLSGADRRPFQHGSGRLELAQAIADKENPLTARVMVNRIWLHHFGAGLVRTPSDFGFRSEPPSHPALLDYLARRFMEEGWSIKKLHRLLMLSSAYQQSSDENPEGRRVDPENTLLWRMNRRRLDLEALRDALLAVSGWIDLTMGGRAVDLTAQPYSGRRTVYGYIDRQNLPGMFRVFDFAGPDTHSPQRHTTTVPQQALFMMNGPFVVEHARRLVERPEVASETDPRRRIHQLYRLLYGRSPTPEEMVLGLRFIEAGGAEESGPAGHEGSPWRYGFGRFDEGSHQVNDFQPLPCFTGEAWQAHPQLPDTRMGFAALRAEGGHPGKTPEQAVIRRWAAPQDGTISIRGTLAHRQTDGDGVRARIVSSRWGELASWTIRKMDAETRLDGVEVRKGDTVDFVVDCRSDPEADTFRWAPVIRMPRLKEGNATTGEGEILEFDSASQFAGPPPIPLSLWGRYAQVLLEANEFAFVD